MTVTQRRRFNDDADDANGPYDPRYPGKRVVADGGRVRVRLHLTDGRPDWMPPTRTALFDARNHRPRSAGLSDVAAYAAFADARNANLRDAYRQMGGATGTGGAARTTAPPADHPGDDDETMTPRDRYIKRMQTAYRTSPGQDPDDDADAIERQREAWSSPGATPGVGTGYGDSAALADAEKALQTSRAAYLDRITNAWRRP
jgi:hypothetical protein